MYDECHRILAFRLFPEIPDLVTLICVCPTIVLLLQSELLYFSTGMSRAHVLCSCCCSFCQSLGCFRSSNTFIAPALESLTGAGGVDPGLNRSRMSLHQCVFVVSFQWAFESLAAPISSYIFCSNSIRTSSDISSSSGR